MVLIMDGNMKNQRDVCLAREAGYIENEGLPGRIKTGCMHSPEHKSCYCNLHSPSVCEVPSDDARGKAKVTGVVASVLEEKTTQNVKYYKVSMTKIKSIYYKRVSNHHTTDRMFCCS